MFVSRNFDKGKTFILYKENVLSVREQNRLLKHFDGLQWYGGDYDGREIMRKQRFYHMEGKSFCDHWPDFERWRSCRYSTELIKLQEKIQKQLKTLKFLKNVTIPVLNSILVNVYENGSCLIPAHRDSEEIFGNNPVIVVLSLGSTRTMRFTRVNPDTRSLKAVVEDCPEDQIDIDLVPGSMIIMAGTTQKYYKHEILRSNSGEKRYSITLREHKL